MGAHRHPARILVNISLGTKARSLPGAGSTGVLFAGEGRQLMEMITSFWTALQVWPSQQGILLGVAAVLAILVLMPGRPSAGGILLSIMLAAVIGFLVAYAVG
jgi:hypothetical protein